ncbi:MAG: putative metal-binding motif-containing protein, partial [Hyphomicrobiales bacterium]
DSADCDDHDAESHPGAVESCNGRDDDCDGAIDEDVSGSIWYWDADLDGYGGTSDKVSGCSAPPGYVAANGDCDDANASVRPGATEACNGADDDCDGRIDEDCP